MQKAIDRYVKAYHPSESAVNNRSVFAGNGFNPYRTNVENRVSS